LDHRQRQNFVHSKSMFLTKKEIEIKQWPADLENSAQSTWASLGELAELIEPKAKNRKTFIEECKSGSLDDVLVTFRTFASIDVTGLFDEELVNVLPEKLKFVCHNGKCSGVKSGFECQLVNFMMDRCWL
jgi:hypothetical protein